MRVRFGEFILDSESHQLLRGHEPIHLGPKAFELLKVLVENRTRAMSKTELHERLWPATFVVENNLAVLVGEIRAAIGDAAHQPHFVRTIHGFGYAFASGAVELSDPAPSSDCGVIHWIVWASRDFRLAGGENILGRDPGAVVRLNSPSVSRRHARIVVLAETATLEDLESKNGTYLRGEKITTPVALAHGDEIRVGSFVLTYRQFLPDASTQTEVII